MLGERLWIRRDEQPVPSHHRCVPHLLNGMNGAATLVAIWGVVALRVWPTLFGAALMYVAKFWYLDRMVWLYWDAEDSQSGGNFEKKGARGSP